MGYDGYVIVGTKVDTTGVDKGVKTIEQKMTNKELTVGVIEDEKKVKNLNVNWQKINNSVKLYKQNLSAPVTTNLSKEIKDVENQLQKVEKTSTNVIKKVSKWALAIFSIRSIYSGIRRLTSTISQYNEQISTDLDYINYSLAQAFAPVIEFVISLVYKLLSVIAMVANALFGVNIFANATAEGFKKANSSANSLKKTIAGFDEMNILNENGGTGIGKNAFKPEVDLSNIIDSKEADEIKSWWKTIFDFWEEDFANFDYSFAGNWELFLEGLITTFKGFWDIIKGVIEASWGIGQMVIGLLTGDEELMRKGWENTVKGFTDFLYGIGEILLGAISLVFGILKGLVLDIYNNVIKPIWDFFYQLGQDIGEFFREAIEKIVGWWKSGWKQISDFFVGIYNGIVGFIDKMVGHWKTGIKIMGDFFTNIFKGIINFFVDAINFVIKGLNKLNFKVPDWVPGIGGENWGFNIKQIPRLAKGTILNNPGKGVLTPNGNAIFAEAGPEAYLPLSDTQLLEQLGSTIGKYITINASITNTMNGRVISRELQKINSSNDFAMNR